MYVSFNIIGLLHNFSYTLFGQYWHFMFFSASYSIKSVCDSLFSIFGVRHHLSFRFYDFVEIDLQ